MGAAGQRIITAGEILAMAAMGAGLQATQKNEYNITVLRGPSISEVIVADAKIGYTGMETPDIILALAQEGVDRRRRSFAKLPPGSLVLCAADVALPDCRAQIRRIDFKKRGIRPADRALASLAILASSQRIVSTPMLMTALKQRFHGQVLASARKTVQRAVES